MVNIKLLITFFLLFIFIKPHFYFYSYAYGRISDFISIMVLTFMFLWLGNLKVYTQSYKHTIPIMIYLFLIIVAILHAASVHLIVVTDLVDITRPYLIVVSFLVGSSLVKQRYNIVDFMNFLITLGLISFTVALLEKTRFPFFYYIYSDNNHFSGNRPTGLFYDFAEYGVVQCLSIISAFISYIRTKKKRYILFTALLIFSVILSTSKASIVLLLIVTLFLLFFYFKNEKVKPVFITMVLTFILIVALAGYQYILNEPALYQGLNDILKVNDNNASVGNRVTQISYVLSEVSKFNIESVIGHSSFKSNPDSYIEVAFFSLLYRYGIIGVILYYFYFLLLFFAKVDKNYSYFKSIIISVVALDIVAAMSDRISGIILINILFGILITEYKNQSKKVNTHENIIY